MWRGRVCIITGATSGIGREMALLLASRGGEVWGIGRNGERLASLETELEGLAPGAGHRVLALDVAAPDDMGRLGRLLKERGRADLLVASAVAKPAGFPPRSRDLSLADWQQQIDVNLHGVYLANQAVLPLMLARQDGDIVNISSSTTPRGLKGTPLAPAYCATKFAIAELSRAMAEELAPEGIRVQSVHPGAIDTPLIADTHLAAPYGGAMSARSFATALTGLIELGRQMAVPSPFLLPMPQRPAAPTLTPSTEK